MPRIVLKFGGASVGDNCNYFDDEHMMKIANTIKSQKEAGNQVVVVISAMAGETRKLKEMCQMIDGRHNTPEDDMVLSVGEQITTGLLSKLLNSEKFNLKAKPFMGWQLPIVTDNNFGSSRIKFIETKKLEECLSEDIVPIIAGFQGITEDNEITTLGFDGSDTSAVAVAAWLKAECCCFYKDVRGVYSANPRRVKNARKIDKLSLKEMYVLSSLGARILHPNSIWTAMEHKLKLRILPNFVDGEIGTIINDGDMVEEIAGITYLEHTPNRITISIVGKAMSNNDRSKIIKELNKNKIFAEVVETEFDHMSITVEIGWIEQLDTALRAIHTLYGLDEKNCSVSAFNGDGKQVYRDPAITTTKN